MFTKLTTATLMVSVFLVACDAPVAENEMIEIPPIETMPTAEMTTPKAAVQFDDLDLTGTYAMSGVACDVLVGTLTIAETAIRVSETVCDITQAREINATTMEYALSDCQVEGAASPDRTITVTQDELGNINLTPWNDQTFDYSVCPL
ncbi:hypothetical protein GCM10009069_23340 [Algimonas arctica]|uniref:Uncharacterized protein n=2 Tax=Algimonas arctica TaxID=1479486 RepID=A0A8J3CU08_9PROT|nr:hypothetical protein GCM10009069_23340 [Algimonas arctica]